MKKKLPEYLLIPFAVIYGIVTTIRNKLFDWQIIRSYEFDIPVICVGNITAGGTGKTPHTEYLISILKKEFRVAVLSRGYRRKTKGFVLAETGSTAAEIGDEPCQIKRKYPDITVAVDEKRVRGIRKLREMDIDVVILDDAFQHRYVKPGLSVLLIDFFRPMTKDALLPFGRLRESIAGIRRANIILITKSPNKLKAIDMRVRVKEFSLNPFQHLYFTAVEAEHPQPVFMEENHVLFKENEAELLLVTGIAQPDTALNIAKSISPQVEQITFHDHHSYREKDITHIINTFHEMSGENKLIMTTEKDAVKLRAFRDELAEIIPSLFYLPVKISFLNNDTENFNSQITSYVRSNKRNSILHQGKNQVTA